MIDNTYLVPELERLKLWDSNLDCRDPSTDLEAAWNINKRGWQWRFEEYNSKDDGMIVVATLYIHGIEYKGSATHKELGIISENSGSAYALARCRTLIQMASENVRTRFIRDMKASLYVDMD